MMRLPRFRYLSPRSLGEAVTMLADAGPEGAVVAGGTDLWPNMKRRQQTPKTVIGLRLVPELRRRRVDGTTWLGANLTLSEVLGDAEVCARHPGLGRAVASISTPQLRNMGTLGGNLCLDTRCNYYDQNYEWRKAIDFCMKKDGGVCWVAPGSPRCWAVSSTDSAPVMVALAALVHLTSAAGERVVPAAQFFADDGIVYLTRRPDEIVTGVELPGPVPGDGGGARWVSTYLKLRRRGSFDFPVLSVAVALLLSGAGPEAVVEEGRVVLGASGSHPVLAGRAGEKLRGRQLSDEVVAEVAEEASRLAKPMDNTDFALGFRKRMAHKFVATALRELRG